MKNLKDVKCLGAPLKCLLTALILLYILSPIDLLPEALMGPIGLIDDIIALFIAVMINTDILKGKIL